MHIFSRNLVAGLLAATVVASPLAAQDAPGPLLTPNDIVAAAPASDWVRIAPSDLMVMDLARDAAGKPRRVVVELMPAPFSQGWVENMRKLVAAHWYDGIAVVRVQDNYVVQWGDPDGEEVPGKAKPLPVGLKVVPESAYAAHEPIHPVCDRDVCPQAPVSVDFTSQEMAGDAYAPAVGFGHGWPLAFDEGQGTVWPVHCYGTVGVGRNVSPDTGTGAELYAVIGHAPRQLDRNIAVVGRVIAGIENLSSLPRGTGELSFYETPEERTPIVSVRMGNEVADLPAYEYLSTDSASFAAYVDKRANRRDDFYIRPSGGVDVCNVPVPVREAP